jgi:hypothetical protein
MGWIGLKDHLFWMAFVLNGFRMLLMVYEYQYRSEEQLRNIVVVPNFIENTR